MADYMTLLGADDVRAGGNACHHAAERMNQAASSIDSTFEMNARRMDDWLNRFENLVERMEAAAQSLQPKGT